MSLRCQRLPSLMFASVEPPIRMTPPSGSVSRAAFSVAKGRSGPGFHFPIEKSNLNYFRTVLEVGWVVDQVVVSRITELKDPGSCLLWELVFYSSYIRSSLVASP